MAINVLIRPDGSVVMIYQEHLSLTALGPGKVKRASEVNPDGEGKWWAQIYRGPKLGPFAKRSEAVAAEIRYLEEHLCQPNRSDKAV